MTAIATPRHANNRPAPALNRSIWRTVYVRAVADKAVIVGALAFYGFAIAVGVGALWLPLQDTFATIAADLPAGFDAVLGGLSIATPVGWMHAELMSILGPGFLIATALISAAAATAGEEQARTMGLVLSTGAPRTTFLAAKATAMITHVLIVGAAIFAGMVVANPIGDLGIEVPKMLAATAQMVLIALVYGAMTLAIGAVTADKRLSLAIPGALFAISFVAASFLGMVEELEWLSKLNFWYPYSANAALADGMHWGYTALMGGLAVGIGAIAFIAFPRRGNLQG